MLFTRNDKPDTITAQRRYGFSFPDEPVGFSAHPAVLCALKALLIFCASFGTVGGVLSAFDVAYNRGVVLLFLAVFSLLLAFLHYSAVIFNLAYPLIFIIFTFSILRCRNIVNSGFQWFVSILHEAYSDYFDLALTRNVTITYNDQYTAVTVAAVFVGFFLALLLNIAISTYMSLLFVLLLTFPVLQLSLYIENYPAPAYLFLLLFSYVAVGVLKCGGHFDLPMKKKKRTMFQVKTGRGTHETYRLHSYRASGLLLVQNVFLIVVISALFMGASYSLLLNHNAQKNVSNSLKAKTDEYVKIYVQSGITGFFNRYAATGGISGGKLGGVSAVRPDYQPDLKVTFAPYGYDAIYLKAYTGKDYTGNEWLPSEETDDQSYLTDAAGMEGERLKRQFHMEGNNLKAEMKIENLDANPGYLYLPYYTNQISRDFTFTGDIRTGSLPVGETLELTYYPDVNADLSSDWQDTDTVYSIYCEYAYSYVSPHLEQTLDEAKRAIGTADTLDELILRMQNYFEDNFTYTMTPGATPMREDFVEYFLTKQKKGYCAHFASSATLLFRSYGYPARYIEGYVLTFDNMTNAEMTGEDYDRYMQGENPLGRTGVISAEITDGNAHAWVEVYREGFGWIPVDVTPPSQESAASYSDFWSIFSGLFSVSGSGTSTSSAELAESGRDRFHAFKNSTDLITGPVLLLICCLILLPILLRIVKILSSYIRMRIAFCRGNYVPLLSYCYERLLRRLRKRHLLTESNPSPQRIHELLLKQYPADGACIEKSMELLQRGCFSSQGITKSEALWVKENLPKIVKRR